MPNLIELARLASRLRSAWPAHPNVDPGGAVVDDLQLFTVNFQVAILVTTVVAIPRARSSAIPARRRFCENAASSHHGAGRAE